MIKQNKRKWKVVQVEIIEVAEFHGARYKRDENIKENNENKYQRKNHIDRVYRSTIDAR